MTGSGSNGSSSSYENEDLLDVSGSASSSSATAVLTEDGDRGGGDASSVQVAVRVRPLLGSEAGSFSCVEVMPDPGDANSTTTSVIRLGGTSGPTFTFDEVFPVSSMQHEVFERRVTPLVRSCLEGYNATILAYGQTGSGKTFTIMGPSTSTAQQDEMLAGVIPRAIKMIFHELENMVTTVSNNSDKENDKTSEKEAPDKQNQEEHWVVEYEVRVQFLELYGEDVRDLLTSSPTGEKLTIRCVGVEEPEVLGATQRKVDNAGEALSCLTRGMLRRVTAATAMNQSSSRSHAILSVLVDQIATSKLSTDKEASQVKRSKFNFVDLAGSERQKRTRAEGQRLREGIDINKGLLVLGNVISALGDPKKRGKTFVPYRDSKLTRLLKGSLGGNHKTLMVACVSPSADNMEETLNCLRYANRAKNIQNHAVVNMDAGARMIAELKEKLQGVARDLLLFHQGGDTKELVFTQQEIEVIASVSSEANPFDKGRAGSIDRDVKQKKGSRKQRTEEDEYSPDIIEEQMQRLVDTEDELNRTRSLLKKCRKESISVDERLCVTKAEKECYRLQLAAHVDQNDPESLMGDKEKLFIDRATEYEKEISQLKEQLRAAETKLKGHNMMRGQIPPKAYGGDSFSIENANKDIEADRKHLASLQEHILKANTSPVPESEVQLSPVENSKTLSPARDAQTLEKEEKDEELNLIALTKKYGADSDEDNFADDENVNNDAEDHADIGNLENDVNRASDNIMKELEADLAEVSRIIDAKEELIKQLQHSQNEYSSMETFYESKLQQMGEMLDQKEKERDGLMEEMRRLEERKGDTRELKQRLQNKDRSISELRKKQRELIDLTTVSKRNELEIRRLHGEVVNMKARKVTLQKQLTTERKDHISEIRKLKKESVQKDREVNKWRRMHNKKESEALKAQNVAKARLGEIGQLRAKFKDAEKRLRLATLKRGVMAKVGLDPVIVGRRKTNKGVYQSRRARAEASQQITENLSGSSTLDVDSIRDYFDQKVAEVGRKEAIANKLAEAWEEHFDLVKKRAEVMQESSETEGKELLQGIDLQMKCQENRIRQLASRLGTVNQESQTSESEFLDDIANTDMNGKSNHMKGSFLFDDKFATICKGVTPAKASGVANKVLFGMIVRERRRIAALARTASSLDEKLQNVQMNSEAQEAAFRSYMDDQRNELMEVQQSHKERIESLTALINEEVEKKQDHSRDGNNIETNPQILAELANEQIAVLERQLHELKKPGQNVVDGYRLKSEELRSTLSAKTDECSAMEGELSNLRSSLRQIRELVGRPGSSLVDASMSKESEPIETREEILAVVSEALHPQNGTLVKNMRRRSSKNIDQGDQSDTQSRGSTGIITPRLKKHIELMHTSDSEDAANDDVPAWADSIMADLALIAEGKVPPSLQDSPIIAAAQSQFERSIEQQQKENQIQQRQNDNILLKSKNTNTSTSTSTTRNSLPKNQAERRHKSQKIANTLDRLVIPSGGGTNSESKDQTQSNQQNVFDRLASTYTGSQKSKRQKKAAMRSRNDTVAERTANSRDRLPLPNGGDASEQSISNQQNVFDRLSSTYTGVQKGKHQNNSDLRNQHADTVAERMLDDLLQSDNESFEEVESIENVNKAASNRRTNLDEYTNQDVFERLQKTPTQSYSVKHSTMSPVGTRVQQHSLQYSDATVPSLQNQYQTEHLLQRENGESHGAADKVASLRRTNLDEYTNQDVFERLQKTTTQSYSVKHAETTTVPQQQQQHQHHPEDFLHRENGASSLNKDIHGTVDKVTSNRRTNLDEYTNQNVFERLQKTTTQSYSVKHAATTVASAQSQHRHPEDLLQRDSGDRTFDNESYGSVDKVSLVRRSSLDEYTNQNVFERLQKTTTQSYSVKHAPTSPGGTKSQHSQQHNTQQQQHHQAENILQRESSESGFSKDSYGTAGSNRRTNLDEYTNQNVFERLQKTTTQSYAVKHT